MDTFSNEVSLLDAKSNIIQQNRTSDDAVERGMLACSISSLKSLCRSPFSYSKKKGRGGRARKRLERRQGELNSHIIDTLAKRHADASDTLEVGT